MARPDLRLCITIGHNDEARAVVLHFERSVTWLAFQPADARAVARMLDEHAALAERAP